MIPRTGRAPGENNKEHSQHAGTTTIGITPAKEKQEHNSNLRRVPHRQPPTTHPRTGRRGKRETRQAGNPAHKKKNPQPHPQTTREIGFFSGFGGLFVLWGGEKRV